MMFTPRLSALRRSASAACSKGIRVCAAQTWKNRLRTTAQPRWQHAAASAPSSRNASNSAATRAQELSDSDISDEEAGNAQAPSAKIDPWTPATAVDLPTELKSALASRAARTAGDDTASASDATTARAVSKEEQKSLSVCILGTPNAGKSQLVNQLVRAKVTAVSPKRNTTRGQVLGIATRGDTQLIVYDTPGINPTHQAKRYQRELSTTAWDTSAFSDVAIVVIDAAKRIGEAELEVLKKAKAMAESEKKTNLILVLNKVDLVSPKPKLLIIAEELCKLAPFFDVFYISALKDDGVAELEEHLFGLAVPREWEQEAGTSTDQDPVALVQEFIREKLFRQLHREVPYGIKQNNVDFRELGDGSLRIEQQLIVPSPSQKAILLGEGGSVLKWITQQAIADAEKALGKKVHLFLRVSVKPELFE